MKKILLTICAALTINAVSAQCNELFLSEYFEGGGENHALEIYNPTSDTISLDKYVIRRYSNGATAYTETRHMGGERIYPFGTFTVVSGFLIPQGTLPAADTALTNLVVNNTINGMLDSCCHAGPADGGGIMVYNGDDAITLEKYENGAYRKVDIFGIIGERPLNYNGGTSSPTGAWTDTPPFSDGQGWGLSRGYALKRHSNIKAGVSTNPALGTFDILAAYDTIPTKLTAENYTSLGNHTCDCLTGIKEISRNQIKVNVTPNPSKGNDILVSTTLPIMNLECINTLGEIILTPSFNKYSNSVTIATSNFQKGVYLLKVSFKNNQFTTKTIVIE